MKAVQMERHDAILLDMAKNISGYDCVVMAQASMAHLDQKIEAICKIPVPSSPGLCMEQVKGNIKNDIKIEKETTDMTNEKKQELDALCLKFRRTPG